MSEEPTTLLLTLEQACERVQLSSWALRRAIDRGELRAFRPCGRIRILESDLDDWLTSTAIHATSGKTQPVRARSGKVSRRFRDLAARERAPNHDEQR